MLSRALSVALLGMASGSALAQVPEQPDAQAKAVEQPDAQSQPATPGPTAAADAAPAPAASGAAADTQTTEMEPIKVIGYRHSIQESTEAKRDAVNTIDTVFAEDIGKFPDLNIAESLSRVPGVQLQRDVNGEGLNVSIRGLGNSFTRTTMDGAPITTASIGLNNQNQNREVDLNLFPTEFFSQLTVEKTPKASTIEGGIAGTVDMRSARPFDNVGSHLTYSLQGGYNSSSTDWNPRGSVIGSWTNDAGTFGLLGGVAIDRGTIGLHGWESVGWTNPGLTYTQCGLTPPAGTPATNQPAACNVGGGGNWRIPDTVPNNPGTVGAGLTPGTVIDNNFLLSHNPGLTTNQISEALIPRLGRPVNMSGDRDRDGYMGSMEWRPSDNAHFYLDGLFSKAHRTNDRIDMNLVGRNGNIIPLDMQVDGNNVVTKATFTNAQFFLEARPYQEDVKYWSLTPGGEFIFTDSLKLNAQINYSRSWMFRESPTVLVNSPFTTIQYSNTSGDFPTWTTGGLNLNDPNAGWTWAGGRVNINNERRDTENKGFRSDLQWGDDRNNLKFGVAYDEDSREIKGFDNSQAWQNVVCGAGAPVGPPNPPCNGAPGSAIPQDKLSSYLLPGPYGYITVDFNRFKNDSNYYSLRDSAPVSGSANTGATTGGFDEKNSGLFFEGNGEWDLAGQPFRANGGVRYVHTDQETNGPVTVNGVTQFLDLNATYHKFLPSFNTAYTLVDNVVLRFSGSRTITRPNPSSMLPNTNFSDPSAQNASQGNPNLAPYLSNNVDLGGEWYTGQEGYVGLALFNKRISGYTYNGINTIPFTALGIPYASLNPTQQAAIDQRGGPNSATVNVQQQVNASNNVNIRGWEANWVQPLAFIFDGLGFTANYTHIDTSVVGSGPNVAKVASNLYGIAPKLWNTTLYWEKGPASVRLSYDYAAGYQTAGNNQNGIPFATLSGDSHRQLDMSASYTIDSWPSHPQITFNATNLTDSKLRSIFYYENATNDFYDPGRSYWIGIRGTF
jgi:TonB-dependent receptor